MIMAMFCYHSNPPPNHIEITISPLSNKILSLSQNSFCCKIKLPQNGSKVCRVSITNSACHYGEQYITIFRYIIYFVVVVVYFILSRLLYLAFSANLGLLCMPHPGMGPQFNVPSEERLSELFWSFIWKVTHLVSDCTQPCLTSVKLMELAGLLGHSPCRSSLVHHICGVH